MKVRFFGKLRDAIGDERDLPVEEGETVAQLRRRLADLHPQAADEILGPRVRACVDDRIVGEDHVVAARERIEFLPPLSGG